MDLLIASVTFVVLLVLGVPVAFSIGISSVLYFVLGGVELIIAAQQVLAGPDSWVLLALPSFILAGMLMNASGISARLVAFANALVGHIRGGLALANVVDSMLFGGISGSATADTAALGTVIIPAMVKEGYNRAFVAALTSSTSSIGIVIPPSIPMIIYGSVAEVSVGKLFLAGLIPGLLMGLFQGSVVYYLALRKGWRPSHPFSWRRIVSAGWAASLALVMPVIIIGGIMFGVFTPTEAGAIACVYGFVVAFAIYGSMSLRTFYRTLVDAAVLTAVVMTTVAFSLLMGWILSHQGIPQRVTEWFLVLTTDPTMMLVLMTALLIVLGGPLDATPLLVIVVPILVPLVRALEIDPVHFGIIVVFTIAISQQSPPVGNPLFVVSAISGEDIFAITKENVPFILTMGVLMYLILFFPEIALFIPRLAPGG
ncbi:MAG: TRAP transporter large permease [Chloroflexi bacterium]|nr:TRAP transporter large permease [Chloroflexota bacterium]